MYNNYEERIELLNKQLVSEYKKNDKLQQENHKLQQENKQLKEIIDKAIEYVEGKENGKCIIGGIEKGAFTFVLDFDKAREFIWGLLAILKGENNE